MYYTLQILKYQHFINILYQVSKPTHSEKRREFFSQEHLHNREAENPAVF